MTIALDTAEVHSAGFAGSMSASRTCTGSNLLLFASFGCNSAPTSATCTYNGVSMTLIKQLSANNQAFNGTHFLFGLIAPATGAHTLLFTPNATTDIAGGAASFTGCDQTTGWDNLAFAFGSSSGTGVVTDSVTVGAGNWGFASASAGNALVADTGTVDWNESLNTGQTAGNNVGIHSSSSGTDTLNVSQAVSAPWAWAGVEILAASGGTSFSGSPTAATAYTATAVGQKRETVTLTAATAYTATAVGSKRETQSKTAAVAFTATATGSKRETQSKTAATAFTASAVGHKVAHGSATASVVFTAFGLQVIPIPGQITILQSTASVSPTELSAIVTTSEVSAKASAANAINSTVTLTQGI